MKRKIISSLLALTMMVLAFSIVSCGPKEEHTLTIGVTETKVHPEDVIAVTAKYDAAAVVPEYTVLSGSKYIAFEGNNATISKNAIDEVEITFFATYQNVTSNYVTLTVEKESTTVSVELSSTKLIPGAETTLTGKVNGEVNTGVTFEFVGTCDFAIIKDGKLKINANAETGSLGSIVAKFGEYTSSAVAFTVVKDTSEELSLEMEKDAIEVDGTAYLGFTLYDNKGKEIADTTPYLSNIKVYDNNGLVNAEVLEGTIKLTSKKHGTGSIGIVYTDSKNTLSEEVDVTSIKTPTTFAVPTAMAYTDYTFGMYKADGTADVLEFDVTPVGTDVCTAYTVSFKKDNETTTDATFDATTKTISFAAAGNYTVVVTSDSGSKNETVLEKKVTVNTGKNARTYQEFNTLANNLNNQDLVNFNATVINVVNDLVIDGDKYFTASEIAASVNHCYGSFEIYGNGFKIDASDVKVLTMAERTAENIESISGIFTFRPFVDTNLVEQHDFDVTIKGLDLVSNVSTASNVSEIMGMPNATAEEAISTYNSLSDADKKNVLNNSYRYGIWVSNDYTYNPVTGKNNGLNYSCNNFTVDDCYFYGFSIGAIGCNNVTTGKISNCVFEGSFASELDLKYGNYEVSKSIFKQCGMASIEFRARAVQVQGQFLPLWDDYEAMRDGNPANIALAMYQKQQGLSVKDCSFDNWLDGSELNQQYGTNVPQTINAYLAGIKTAVGSDVPYLQSIYDNGYNFILVVNKIETYALALSGYCTISFTDANGDNSIVKVPFPSDYSQQKYVGNMYNITNETVAAKDGVDLVLYSGSKQACYTVLGTK